jgi:hypothetical protein
MFHLFLDDERLPEDVHWLLLPDLDWVVVRSYDEFVRTVQQRGVPATVSFDHDLCDEHYQALLEGLIVGEPDREFAEKTGYHCAEWLLAHCRALGQPPPAAIYVHTLNPIGRERIRALLAAHGVEP